MCGVRRSGVVRLSLVGLGMWMVCAPVLARGQFLEDDPIASGYVTRVDVGGGFAVQGSSVLLTPKTKFFTLTGKKKAPMAVLGGVYLGQGMIVWGKVNSKTRIVTATEIEMVVPGDVRVSGMAIVDAEEPGEEGVKLIRADGYRMRLGSATTMHFNDTVSALDKVGTNVWIAYSGMQGKNGVVAVTEAEVWPNVVDENEDYLKRKKEFDAAGVGEKDKQSAAGEFFLGTNYKKLPAHTDEELQVRVERIGRALIPAYQKALAQDDPTRIRFRFQVVDAPKLLDGVAFASGIILIPFPAVTRLSSDAELATVLADNIACVLEKQDYVHAGAAFRLKAANLIGLAGAYLTRGATLMAVTETGSIADHIRTEEQQQSGRVSLWLLRDAGYDIRQAPLAWWKLASKKPEALEKVEVPDRASNLYLALGTTFRQEKQVGGGVVR